MWVLFAAALAEPVDFNAWAARQQAPEEHPERAEGWDFAATLWHRASAVVQESPGVVEPFVVGRSVEKRPIWGFRVAAPGQEPVRRLLVFSQLHALEWIGPEVTIALLESLEQHTPAGVEVVLVPIVNPDGRWRAEQDLLNELPRSYRRANANGVDLNRDFAVNREPDTFWSKVPVTRNYFTTSPGPLSQPETQALDALMAEGFDVGVDLHSYGGYIEYPWAGTWDRSPEQAQMAARGQRMAAAQPGRAYGVIQLSHFLFFFRGLGMSIDHMHGQYDMEAYLIELTRTGLSVKQPSTFKDYFRWYNPVDKGPHLEAGLAALLQLVRELSAEAEASP
jgi:hypothetical protein